MKLAKLRRGNDIVNSALVHEVPADAVDIDHSRHIKIGHDLIRKTRKVANLVGDDGFQDSNLKYARKNSARFGYAVTCGGGKADRASIVAHESSVDPEIAAGKSR